MSELLAASPASDWRPLAPEDTLLLDLPAGRVVIALAPAFAPRHAANLRALARQRYFDGLAIVRAQEGFVVQWGDPAAGEPGERPITGPAGRCRQVHPACQGLFTSPDGDVTRRRSGSDGLPAARPGHGLAWLVHCYSMVGAGRDTAPDSGGAELTRWSAMRRRPERHGGGQVVQGMEHLSTASRPAPMGFIADAGQRTPIRAVRVAADLPEAERVALEVLRTDSPTFTALVEARRNRRDAWYLAPAGRIDLCSVPLPVRPAGR
jgi:peptidylprolyl isomerase